MNINGWIHNGGTVMHLYSSLKYEDGKEKRVMKGRKREIRQLVKCVTVRRGFWPADLLHGFLHISPPFCSPSSSILFTMGRAFAFVDVYISYTFFRVRIASWISSRLVDHRQTGTLDITYGYFIFRECILISKLRTKRYS